MLCSKSILWAVALGIRLLNSVLGTDRFYSGKAHSRFRIRT